MTRRSALGLATCVVVLAAAGWWLLAHDADDHVAARRTANVTTTAIATVAATTIVAPTEPAPPAPSPLPLAGAVGQRIVTGYLGGRPTASILAAIRAGRLGGVILFSDNVPTQSAARNAVLKLRAAAKAGGQPAPFVMIDQEGGAVRRIADAPPTLSPARMGASTHVTATAHSQGRATGRALRRLGIDIDLAPVADVPSSAASFLGTRAFSRTPAIVARGACAFASGLRESGVAGTFKHFPGLGRAGANTDLKRVVISSDAKRLERDLAAYRACPSSPALVMVSSASYPKLGIDGPAVLSSNAYRLLAGTGFRGLTISDAFDTPAVLAHRRPALHALQAGVDLLLYGQGEAASRLAYDQLLRDADAGRLDAAALRASAQRILAFKGELRRGLRP